MNEGLIREAWINILIRKFGVASTFQRWAFLTKKKLEQKGFVTKAVNLNLLNNVILCELTGAGTGRL